MKNILIGFFIVCLILVLSFLYKAYKQPVLGRFPIVETVPQKSGGEPRLYLFLFFSRHNCSVCMESIEVLNLLPETFVVKGIVPANELQDKKEFRLVTGARFELLGLEDGYASFAPHYSPALYGVTGSGKILFLLPGVPDEKTYLNDFLVNFYCKSLNILRTRRR